MANFKLTKNSLEVLEARIAPAAAAPLLPTSESNYVKATLGAPVEVKAGQVLSTTGGSDGGYLLFVEKGNALVFFTDLNNNRQVDFNEITGISAGDGLQLISFTDIHGDIVTNLRETTATFPGGPNGQPITKTILTLSDSDSNPANDSLFTKGDGRVLLNNTIEKIELRSLRVTDIADQNNDGVIDDVDVSLRKVPSTYSIFGNIFAGKGFGSETGGLIIDDTGGTNFGFEFIPVVGSIKTGTAVSGEYFSFGASNLDDTNGTIVRFTPPRGQAGGDIVGVKALSVTTRFLIDEVHAGDGGFGARGGDVKNIVINNDDTGGYSIIAGNGGGGLNGGAGGSILNFSDLGSATSKVVIRSGAGGAGSTGTGGNGGNFSFDKFNLRGNVVLELGDGGDGFTGGGTGASLAKGDFSQPDVTTFLRGNAYGTTHLPSTANWQDGTYTPVFGTHEAVDFDGDGFGDFVYTTKPQATGNLGSGGSQVVVMFGNGNGGFRQVVGPDGLSIPDRVYLSGVRNPEALTVGDFDGDGHPDIAVASNDLGNHAGIAVFLSKYEHEGAGPITGSEDLNGNGLNDFLGFSGVRWSTLPQLQTGDPLTGNAILGFAEGPIQVTSLAAGDFDGDGKAEIAVVATYYETYSVGTDGAVTNLGRPDQVLVYLTADTEKDNITGQTKLTGQFYADFGTKGFQSGNQVVDPEPKTPFTILKAFPNADSGTVIIEATALSNTADHDSIVVAIKGSKDPMPTIDYMLRDGNLPPVTLGGFVVGRVDTDRELGANHISLTDFFVKDFTLMDYDNDGNVDVVAISADKFVIGSKGDGLGSGVFNSGTGPANSDYGDNSGNFIDVDGLFAIKSADVDGDGVIDDFGLLITTKAGTSAVQAFKMKAGIQAVVSEGGFAVSRNAANDEVMFDVHHAHADTLAAPAFATAEPGGGNSIVFSGPDPNSTFATAPLFEVGLRILAGDGGNSSVGTGGKGGTLGGPATLVKTIDPVTLQPVNDLKGALNFVLSGDLRLLGGRGGDGFASGGEGGDIQGVTLRYRRDGAGVGASLVGGDGGRGITGTGGAGGSLSQLSIESDLTSPNVPAAGILVDEVYLTSGNGGAGAIGGAGGAILGNKTVVPDALTGYLSVIAGSGGAGSKRGGDGGGILNLAPTLRGFGDGYGDVLYTAGSGGDAVSGRGGDGGSILNSAPRKNAFVSGQVSLFAGNAGSGTIGGNGGSVTTFNLTLQGAAKTPFSFDAIAGHGGAGYAGVGGVGGNASQITVPSRGLGLTNRVLAGNGGASASAAGGAGGNVNQVVSSSVEGAFAVAAGAGGAGLTLGGRGGSILNSEISVGASTLAKVLAIAGAGGDATAFLPIAGDDRAPFAFGGRVGQGGNGGSIDGFKQQGSNGSHVDLIGGNGGSTLNYGTVFDTKNFVGVGGSIKNINLAGDIGNVAADLAGTPEDENVAIKSYNNIFIGETIASWVENNLRLVAAPQITDGSGNVGVVVGAAGRNQVVFTPNGPESQPATNGVNGSLINVSAKNLMSAVAGSVDRIASIQVTKNLRIVNGIIGADKGSYINGGIDPAPPDASGANKGNGDVDPLNFDYLLQDANTKVPFNGVVRDGALIDGALVTHSLVDANGDPVNLQGRVFIL